jgi:hypothetical protein
MKIVWVTNDVWYSKMLLYLFDETTSHVGTIWDINSVDLVIDQNKPTGTMWSLKYWLKKYRIVHQVELELSQEKELELFKYLEARTILLKYDMGGYYYGMIWGLLHKWFKIPYPKVNKWAKPDEDMCQEIIIPLLKHQIFKDAGMNSTILDFSTMTPDMTMKYLKGITGNNWKWKHNV